MPIRACSAPIFAAPSAWHSPSCRSPDGPVARAGRRSPYPDGLPGASVLDTLIEGGYRQSRREALAERETTRWPPFTRLALIRSAAHQHGDALASSKCASRSWPAKSANAAGPRARRRADGAQSGPLSRAAAAAEQRSRRYCTRARASCARSRERSRGAQGTLVHRRRSDRAFLS